MPTWLTGVASMKRIRRRRACNWPAPLLREEHNHVVKPCTRLVYLFFSLNSEAKAPALSGFCDGCRVIIVSNQLPVRVKAHPRGGWAFEWDEDALVAQAKVRRDGHNATLSGVPSPQGGKP